jgi:hypothetical protein
MAARINHDAVTRFPLDAKMIAIKPETRLSEVIKFGICFILWCIVIWMGVKLEKICDSSSLKPI